MCQGNPGKAVKGQGISSSLKNVCKNHSISVSTKIWLLKTLVWPVATCGCVGWTTRKAKETRISAFEMKSLRQILWVSWMAKNEWVLETTGVDRSLFATVKQRKLSHFGHILRRSGDCLEKEVIQVTIPGSRTRGRPKMAWINNITSWTGLPLCQLLERTRDRVQWRMIVHSVTWSEDDDKHTCITCSAISKPDLAFSFNFSFCSIKYHWAKSWGMKCAIADG